MIAENAEGCERPFCAFCGFLFCVICGTSFDVRKKDISLKREKSRKIRRERWRQDRKKALISHQENLKVLHPRCRDFKKIILFVPFDSIQRTMAKKSNHVVPASSGWAVKKSGSIKASRTFDTKEKAVTYGRELSRNEKTELYIHKKNGMIQDKNSYGKDPNPPKDGN